MICLLGGFMNWFVRGGGWKSAIYKNNPPFQIHGLDWINGTVFGLLFGYLSFIQYGLWPALAVALWGCLAMVLGAVPAWGPYIRAMLGQDKQKSVAWGFSMMTLRGGFWGACLAAAGLIPFLWQGMPNFQFYALAAILAGFSQGLVYYGTILLFRKIKDNFIFNHWTLAEMIHGAFLWSALYLV